LRDFIPHNVTGHATPRREHRGVIRDMTTNDCPDYNQINAADAD